MTGKGNYNRHGEAMQDVLSAVSFSQGTVCVPPEGERCELESGVPAGFRASQAKRHAMYHPGHVVVHRSIRETRYYLPRQDDDLQECDHVAA